MRTYERLSVKPIHIALISALLITTNPLQMPKDPSANAVEIVEPVLEPKPVLVERTPEAAKEYAKTQLAEFGWDTPKQWACLVDLWTGESNWRPQAYNKQPVYQNGERLHAGGIPQILGLDPDTRLSDRLKEDFFIFNLATTRHAMPIPSGTEIFGTRVGVWMKNRKNLPR
jgi:hypothetical protein